MSLHRVALGVLIGTVVLALTGCGAGAPSTPAASWHEGHGGVSGGGQGGGGQPLNRGISDSDPSTSAKHPSSATSPSAPASPATSTSPAISASASATTGVVLRQTGSNAVALTFDDGPGPDTPTILAMLKANNVKATFCLIGVNVKAHHDLVQQIVNDGHTLCNHSWKHDEQLGKKTPDQIRADLQMTNDEIHLAVPNAPIKYFRHPGGNFTPAAIQVAADMGMASLGWSVDPGDWNLKKWTGQQMTDHIVANVRNNTKPGSIVLSHDAGGERAATINAYKILMPELKKKYTLVPMP